MAPLGCTLSIWLLLAQGTLGIPDPPTVSSAEGGTAIEEVSRICSAISSEGPLEEQRTFVFVLLVAQADCMPKKCFSELSFNFLWKLPRAHVYMSRKPSHLKANDREIVLSWEDEIRYSDRAEAPWDLDGKCGYFYCRAGSPDMERFNLEKRVLIQIRRISRKYEKRLRDELKQRVDKLNYFHRFRCSFVVLREQGSNSLIATHVVKRTGEITAGQLIPITLEELKPNETDAVFGSEVSVSNGSVDFDLSLLSISFQGRQSAMSRIVFENCEGVST